MTGERGVCVVSGHTIYYGARARAGGTCLVAVLHAASVIGCGVCASGAVRCITLATPAARRTPPTPDETYHHHR